MLIDILADVAIHVHIIVTRPSVVQDSTGV
jgi:hypothetical protein